jgi:hypothetical protein
MRKNFVRAAVGAFGLLSAMGIASAAQATDFSINTAVSGGYAWVNTPPGYVVGTIHDTNTNTNEGVYIGTIQLTGDLLNDSSSDLATLHVFCIDIHDNLASGTFNEVNVADLSNTSSNLNVHYTAQQVSDLTKFLAYVDDVQGGVTDAFSSAVAQLGVWEIISESSNTNWNVLTGAFSVEGLDSGITSAANSWLNASKGENAIGYTLHVLNPAGGNQTQAFVTHVPGNTSTIGVPEPATWGMIVLGFGLLGSALRRRKEEESFA